MTTIGNGQPPEFDGKTEIAVRLNVDTWNIVLSLIAKGPWEIANPVILAVQQQLRATLAPLPADHDRRPDA